MARARQQSLASLAIRVLVGVWLLISFGAVVISLIAAWREDEQAENAINVTVGGRPDDLIRIQAHINADRIEPGTTVDLWFLVQNESSHPIRDLTIRGWVASGFQPTTFAPPSVPVLGANQVVFFRPRTPLIADGTPQKFVATAEFEWRDDRIMHRRPISLGPISVRSTTEPRIFSVSKSYVGYLKDFFLPIVLLLMTGTLTRRQQASETDRASWNLMLEKIHANTEQHYLPIAAAASNAADACSKTNVADPDTFTKVTFELLLFRKRARVLFERIGGFYFTTRLAESVVVQCEDAFLTELGPHVSRELLEAAKTHVGRYMEVHTFKRDALNKPEVNSVRDGLISWMTTDPDGARAAFSALGILRGVVEYDVNLIYRFWYDEPPDPLDKMTTQMQRLRSASSERLQNVAKLYDEYYRRMAKRKW